MREIMTFLTAVVVLAIAQTLTTALGIVLLFFGLMGVVAFPRQTFGLIGSLGLLVLALKEPAVCVVALGAIGVAMAITNLVQRRRNHRSTTTLLITHEKA